MQLETLRPKTPKSASLSQVGKAERNIRKTAMKNLKDRLINHGSGKSCLKEWSRVNYNASRFKTIDVGGPL